MAVQYSIQKMVSDGTLSTIALGIQYLQRNDIYIRIAGEETPQSGAPSGYTWSFINNTTLKILPVVPNGVEVVVYRRTDIDAMYNIYSQNAQFDEATIDENNQQLLYIAQEYLEQGIPGAGVDTLEFVRDDGTYTYYRIKRTDGSYSDEFAVPSAGSTTKIFAREALRRSYAEAGYNLVDGSFEAGGTLVNANDVLLQERTGKAFSGPAGTVAPGTNPIGDSTWAPRADQLLRVGLSSDNGASYVHFKPSLLSGALNKALTEFIYDQIIDVTWFAPEGYLPDWNAQTQTGNDYTAAVQAAINAYALLGNKRQGGKRAIKFPIGHYKLTSVTIPGSMGFGIDLIGAGKNATVIWSDPSDLNPTVTDGIGFTNFRGMSCFGGLSESGASTVRKAVFYKGKLDSNLADIDVRFSDCIVGYADSFAQAYGRGVIFDQGTTAVYCGALLEIVCDPSTVFSSSVNHKTTTGMRHYSLLGIRADVVSRLIKITGTAAQKDHIHGIQIVGCDFAACDRLIEGVDATIRGAVIADNRSLDSFAGGVVTVKSATNSIDIGNVWRNLHDESVLPASNADCIQWIWDVSGAVAGLSVVGTNASNIRSGVVRTGAASLNVQIKDCQFPQFATVNGGDANHWVYYSTANCDGLQITGNQFTTSTTSGAYRLYDETVQTSNKTRVRDNTAPFTWADHRLRYTPSLLVNGVASVPVGTPSYYARIGEVTQNHVTVDIMMAIDPSETSGVLAIPLPAAFPAIAENASITGSYSGGGTVNKASGFSGTTAPFAPVRVNPATQQAEIWLATGPSGTQANASHTSGDCSLFVTIRYRYA